MNKRLLTDVEKGGVRDKFIDLPHETQLEDKILEAQDAKTLREAGKGLEKVIRSSILDDDGWVYTIPKSFVEALKEGRLPE